MQIEQENQISVMPEIAPPVESTKSKRTHGGKRPGAGRKPNLAKHLLKGVHRDTIIQAVSSIDVVTVISGLLHSKKEMIRLQTLNFVFDRIFGKPKQDVSLSGGLLLTPARDPHLAGLPKEALEELARSYDQVLVKYPVLDVPQDGAHNQIESKPAIEAEVIAPEEQRINFYPDASSSDRVRSASSLPDDAARVSFAFERPSPDNREPDRKNRKEPSQETTPPNNRR